MCVLDYLRAYLVANHRLPSMVAIAKAFGWASPDSANLHMQALFRGGLVTTGEDGHAMLATERVHLLPLQAPDPTATLALVRALLDPEDLGYAVPAEVRARARQALGLPPAPGHTTSAPL